MTERDLFGFLVPAGGVAAPTRQLPLPLTVVADQRPGQPSIRFQIWSGRGEKAMGQNTVTLQDESAIGARWAAALRRRHVSAKEIARAFDVEVRTAEGWLQGHAPYAKYLLRAWRLHGAAVVAEVLAPGSDWQQSAAIDAALGDLENKLQHLKDELAQLRIGD